MSKTITIEKELFEFNELSDSAKEKARQNYLEVFRDTDIFTEDLNLELEELFPESYKNLNYEYSLSYCQGDGVNLYGKMEVSDAVNYVMEKKGEKIDKDTKRFFEWLKNLGYTLVLPCNNRYGYCCVEYNNYDNSILDDLIQDDYTSGIDKKEKMLLEFDKLFKSCIKELCREKENAGYSFFYEVDDEEIQEICKENDYMFTEDGKIYYL